MGREHLLKAGLYDEKFRLYGGEDVEMGFRLEKEGLVWIYCPDARGFHHHTKDFDAYIVDQRRSGAAIVKVYKKFPEIKEARKIDIVTEPLTRLRFRRLPMALFARVARWFPSTVSVARVLARHLGKWYRLRRGAYYLYKYVGYAAYADGMREELGLRCSKPFMASR